MSVIANKRRLIEAVQTLIRRSEPDLPEMREAADALAQVFSDICHVDVQLVMRMDRAEVARVLATTEGES